MGDSSFPTPVGITEDMIERAAHAMLAQQVGNVSRKPVEWQWENVLTGTDREIWRHNVRAVLEAALAGRTVVDLPEPNFTSNRPRWSWWGREEHVQVQLNNDGSALITIGGRLKSVEDAEETALRLLAAVRRVRRLAAESSETCCDLHGEHCEPPADLCCADCSAGVLPWTGQVTT